MVPTLAQHDDYFAKCPYRFYTLLLLLNKAHVCMHARIPEMSIMISATRSSVFKTSLLGSIYVFYIFNTNVIVMIWQNASHYYHFEHDHDVTCHSNTTWRQIVIFHFCYCRARKRARCRSKPRLLLYWLFSRSPLKI